ncbi:MAG: malonyl-[acyl-carrier protein] O-methyltransferase BioC [Betaproteobacteria bacterium]|nr:MAG: malonyl-[acyl-carrier protein] O-methyltransferase BioC [Betaproteobacteria bacterium]
MRWSPRPEESTHESDGGQIHAAAPGLALNAPPLERCAVRRASSRAAATYAGAAVLAREVEARMLERLQYILLDPVRILDAGCGAGHGARRLAERYPGARVLGLDFALPMLQAARSHGPWLRRVLKRAHVDYLCADFASVPLPAASVDLAWSNLALHCADDPLPALKELRRVLKTGGLLMFSCYGPDTLKELKSAFAAHDGAAHVHGFIDMHDLGDMLSACAYSAPVMDMEVITLTYADVDALLADLRATGQQNALAERRRGLTGKRVFRAMRAAYADLRRDGRLPASFEIVYGHAWKPPQGRSEDGRAIVTMQPRRAKGV